MSFLQTVVFSKSYPEKSAASGKTTTFLNKFSTILKVLPSCKKPVPANRKQKSSPLSKVSLLVYDNINIECFSLHINFESQKNGNVFPVFPPKLLTSLLEKSRTFSSSQKVTCFPYKARYLRKKRKQGNIHKVKVAFAPISLTFFDMRNVSGLPVIHSSSRKQTGNNRKQIGTRCNYL